MLVAVKFCVLVFAVVSTFAGIGNVSGTNGGWIDGVGTAAAFKGPTGLVVDASGSIWVADSGNHAIRCVTYTGGKLVFSFFLFVLYLLFYFHFICRFSSVNFFDVHVLFLSFLFSYISCILRGGQRYFELAGWHGLCYRLQQSP